MYVRVFDKPSDRYYKSIVYCKLKQEHFDKFIRKTIDLLNEKYKVTDIQVTSPRSGTQGNVGIEANVHNSDFSTNPGMVSQDLEAEEFVIFAIESI